GLVSSSIPKYKLVPVGKEDDRKAELGNKLLDWVWDNSNGIYTYRNAIKAALVDNMSYLHVICPRDKRIRFVKLGFDEVVIDPNSKHPLFDDAEMIMIKRYVPVEYVRKVFGITDIISEVPNEFYTIYPELMTTQANFLGKVFDSGRRYVNLYECYRKEPDPNSFDFSGRIVKETVIGYMHAFREDFPESITEYPIIPLYVEGYDNPYKRGEVFFLKTIQKFINKTYGVTLLNAQLMSNPKIFIRDRDIPKGDVDEFQANYAAPGSVNILTGDAEPPMVVGGQPLNNAFFSLYLDAKQEFEWLTLPDQILGFGKQKEQTSDLLDMKESAIESMKDFLSVVDMACSRLGLVSLQYVQAFADTNMLVNIPDNKGRRHAVELNKEQGLDMEDDNSVAQYIEYMKQNGASEEEIYETLGKAQEDLDYVKSLEYILNETNFSAFDVRVVPGSYSPTYQMAMMRLMIELVEVGAVDPSMVLEYAPVENREELKQRFDEINRLRSEVESSREEAEIYKKQAEESNKKLINKGISVEQEKAKVKLDRMQAEMKLKAMRAKFKDQLMTEEKMIALENEIKQLLMETQMELFLEKEKVKQTMVDTNSEGISVDDIITAGG
ncbi:MAG: hypothetical protein WC179_09090, partial [Candidatus Cloacimonadaceae bacterium]